jgi:hypothetical protein
MSDRGRGLGGGRKPLFLLAQHFEKFDIIGVMRMRRPWCESGAHQEVDCVPPCDGSGKMDNTIDDSHHGGLA